jgi:hypothetical protein
LIIGGTMSSGTDRTWSVCGSYWSSSNASVRSTTAPGVTARSFPTVNLDMSTLAGSRGGVARSRTRLRAPRTKFAPPVSIAAFSAAGFDHG